MVRWAAVIVIGRELAGNVATVVAGLPIHWALTPTTIWIAYLGPALVLALFIARRDQATGIVGLLWCLVAVHSHLPAASWIYGPALPIIGCGLMTIAPRRAPDPGRSLILVPLLAWAVFIWTRVATDDSGVGYLLWHSGVGYLLPVVAAALFVTVKPALALATALSWSLLGASYLTSHLPRSAPPLSIELLGSAAILLALTSLSRRVLTRNY